MMKFKEQAKGLWSDMLRVIILLVLAVFVMKGAIPLAAILSEPAVETLGLFSGFSLLGLAAAHMGRRVLLPNVRMRQIVDRCQGHPDALSRIFLGACIVLAAIILTMRPVQAAELPPGAVKYLPVLQAEQKAHWPGMPFPSVLAAQVEQETCITLKHSKCWSPRAELKTSREYGFGLGQITVTERFNVFQELRQQHASLRGWTWENRFDATLQLRALVLKDLQCFRLQKATATPADGVHMMLACYNGGAGGVIADRRLCKATQGCDPGRWFGHVERTSYKARLAVAGYGKSFFEINRGYVRAIWVDRRPRYVQAMGEA